MSMEMLTVLQLIGIFCAYLLVTAGLPAFVLGGKLKNHRAPERFLIYFMTGNFYVMNLVFVLQLLKISYPFTLAAGTLVPAAAAWITVNKIPMRKLFREYTKKLHWLTGGQMGARTAVYKTAGMLRRQLARFGRYVWHYLSRRFLDCLLTCLLLAVLWYVYGSNLLVHYGYKASDLLVHNYWINSLSDNDIFVAGVYPYGFHCICYYLHAVFGIETFVILRVFAFVQNVMLHLTMLCVLRLCCRSRYLAYLGVFVYAASSYFRVHTYSRFYATLPQEFGILFILPAIYFGFAYFEVRRKERMKEKAAQKTAQKKETSKPGEEEQKVITSKPGEEEQKVITSKPGEEEQKKTRMFWGKRARRKSGKEKAKAQRPGSWVYLAGFCMSFSMTLAVHFYGTMVAGLFCLAMVIGYCFLFFRRGYFLNVVKTAFLSVVIAVLPMLVAFLMGTPLQGSLGWGMNIILGDDKESSEEEAEEEQQAEGTPVPGTGQEAESGTAPGGGQAAESGTAPGGGQAESGTAPGGGQAESLKQRIRLGMERRLESFSQFAAKAWEAAEKSLSDNVFQLPFPRGVQWVLASFAALILLGVLYLLLRKTCYGAMLISTGIFMFFMCIMMTAGVYGLPSLMDSNRGSIYFAYCCPMALTFLLDGVLYLPFFWMKGRVQKVGRLLLNTASLACAAWIVCYMQEAGQLREPRDSGGQEMDETVVCLTNIIDSEKDFTWTIVSANDELRMGWDYGYHYETITFLEEMEHMGTNTMIRIPTPVVYFFIEKIPQDYNVAYEGSGQPVSKKGAFKPLPANSGIGVYQGEKRWIVMSKMYYWAEAFRKLCPNEMDVYMETDRFICYRLEQNMYRLYNFAIDYGFNEWAITAADAAD